MVFLGHNTIDNVKNNVVIPDHKLVVVPFKNKEEAHYLCAILNSAIARFFVKNYTVGTQISTHILEYIKIPKYAYCLSSANVMLEVFKQA